MARGKNDDDDDDGDGARREASFVLSFVRFLSLFFVKRRCPAAGL